MSKTVSELKAIGFDGKRAVMNYSGLGNYSRLVLELVANELPECDLRLYTPKIKANPQLEPLLRDKRISLVGPDTLKGRLLGSFWRSRWMSSQLKREGMDLYHGVSNQLPAGMERTGIPSVVTIHDVIFMRHPEFYHKPDVAIYTRHFRRSAEIADRIIAISECTRHDLMECLGVPSQKIDLVYQGCDASFYRPVTESELADVRSRYNLPDRYIVGVGTIERRKNQLLAVKALAQLPKDLNLVLVGRPTDYVKEILKEATRLGVSERVRLIHGAAFRDFPAFYAGAIASSYPSWYEGFGIPVIESIAAGTPVIAATGSCLEEAGGPGAIYVSPSSEREFAQAVEQLTEESGLSERMVTEGRDYIRRFSHSEMTRGLMDSYAKTLAMK